ncbi:MAG: hypothetical protein MI922_27480 [Bacteroidales bacterium]|nr:hypothetical protein [Bacteroidales bacterium]
MIKYKYNHELEILETFYIGTITSEELIDYGQKLITDTSLPKKLRILVVALDCEYNISIKDFHSLLAILEGYLKHFEWVKSAIVQSRPREIAIGYMVDEKTSHMNYYRKIFQSREKALAWLVN